MKLLRSFSLFAVFFLVSLCSIAASAQIQFDRPKIEPPLDNPYTMSVPREQIVQTVKDVLKTCAIVVDDQLSKPNEGKIVTKPIIFSKGVTTRTDLEYLATFPASDVRNWLQGRYSLEITALPLDQKRSQLFISALIQGRVMDGIESKWIDGQSNGRLEDEVLRGLAGKILGIDLSIKKTSQRRLLSCEY